MTTDPKTDRPRALHLLEAADFLHDAHFRDGLSVQEIGTALRHMADEADPMVGSLARDGVGLDEIAAMLAAEPVPPAAPDETLRDRVAALFRHPPGVERLGDATPGEIADAVLSVLPPDGRAGVLLEAAGAIDRKDADQGAPESGVRWATSELRRLAAESTVTPPPALTEAGRLRAQVEVLQQDAERDQGLAKVGARCMREGHQGLIEQGRMTLEGWRFALSTALNLGTGAPWDAIHDRVKELAADRPAILRDAADAAEGVAIRLHREHHVERSNGAYDVMNVLAALARETAVGERDEQQAQQGGAETPVAAPGSALARYIADQPVSVVQAMFRILGWPPLRLTVIDEDEPAAAPVAAHTALAAQAGRQQAALTRIGQMADHWEQQLPEVIRTPAVVSAIRAALERADAPAAPVAGQPPADTGEEAGTVCVCGHTRGEHIRVGGLFGKNRLLCDSCDPDSTENLVCKEFEAL